MTQVWSDVIRIKDVILRLGLGGKNDDYSTIMRKKKKVATQIKKHFQSLALSTHCDVHSLNLACGEWIRNSTVLSK